MCPGHVQASSSNAAPSRPRSPGSVHDDPLGSTSSTQHHRQPSFRSQDDNVDGDALMTHTAGEENDDQEEDEEEEDIDDSITTGAEHGEPSETDDGEDDGGDGDDNESLCYGHHHPHQHLQHEEEQHHHLHHHHAHAHAQHHYHGDDETPTHPPQAPFFDDLDGYISDDLDMSDDAGIPLASYLDLAQLLTDSNNMDLDDEFEYEDFHSPGNPPGNSGSDNSAPSAPAGDAFYPANGTLTASAPYPPPSNLNLVPNTYYHSLPPFSQPPMFSVSHITSQLQQLVSQAEHSTDWFAGAHPVALSNPSPGTLGPGNYNLIDFLHNWARQSRGLSGLPRERGRYPWPSRIHELSSRPLTHVQYADLNGDQCDLQGLDWDDLGVTRKEARERRLLTYNNYVNQPGTDRWAPNLPDVSVPRSESYFRFRRMDIRRNVKLSHFQLRNILAGTSRTSYFYPGLGAVYQFDPLSGTARTIMKLNEGPGSQVSTISANHNVLIAGCFNGEYVVKHLDSEEGPVTACHDGTITHNASGITNQIQIHTARTSSSLMAAFASNDTFFRMLDIGAQKWVSREKYPFPLNCSALSPDKRLRVMVGDDHNVLITAAESTMPGGRPEVLKALAGHRDYGFACDWADDGWTVATGFQDKSIKIWDARWWTDSSGFPAPVCTLRAEMAGVRSLRFSPIGSGKRVLVAAEEADFVNIIDARSFRSKQTIDIFGEIGGVDFTNDGQDLTVLCCDPVRGGLLQLERCGLGAESTWNADEELSSSGDYHWRRGPSFDWQPSRCTEEGRIKIRATRRRRRAADLDAMEPF